MSKIYDKYIELKKMDNNKLYLFKSGKFYIFIAEDCDTINDYIVLKKVPFSTTYKCGFPDSSLEQYLRVFKNQKLNIEIIEKIEEHSKYSIVDEIKMLDLDNMSPKNALILLYRYKEEANE